MKKKDQSAFGGQKMFIPKGFVPVTFQGSSQKYGYILVNKKGTTPVTSSRMPIYWLKKVAVEDAKKYNCTVKKVWIFDQPTVDKLNHNS